MIWWAEETRLFWHKRDLSVLRSVSLWWKTAVDQIVKRWWRYDEERLQIGVAFVRTLEKKNERLSKSLIFIWYFLLFAFVHGVDSDYIREVHGGFNFLTEKNPTFSYLPVSAHTKEVWGRLAAWNWENQCCMGRQSEGSTWRGAEDRMLLHNSWAFLAARVHFPVRTPAHNMKQCSTRKGSICVGRPASSLIHIFHMISTWFDCCIPSYCQRSLSRS